MYKVYYTKRRKDTYRWLKIDNKVYIALPFSA